MKKFLALVLSAIMVLSMVACGNNAPGGDGADTPSDGGGNTVNTPGDGAEAPGNDGETERRLPAMTRAAA